MTKETFVAVIPVRAGSRRLKNKNILPFGDTNLLIHKIRQLKAVPEIDTIVVSSDSEEMLDMALGENVKIHRRSLPYADEITKTFNEVVECVAKEIEGDYMIWTPCVCPLAESALYSYMLQTYKEKVMFSEKYDSLISARMTKEYLWAKEKPLNYVPEKHVPSQFLPDWYSSVNILYVAKRQLMIEHKYFYGNNPYLFEVNKIVAVDIDDEYDLEICRALYAYINK